MRRRRRNLRAAGREPSRALGRRGCLARPLPAGSGPRRGTAPTLPTDPGRMVRLTLARTAPSVPRGPRPDPVPPLAPRPLHCPARGPARNDALLAAPPPPLAHPAARAGASPRRFWNLQRPSQRTGLSVLTLSTTGRITGRSVSGKYRAWLPRDQPIPRLLPDRGHMGQPLFRLATRRRPEHRCTSRPGRGA